MTKCLNELDFNEIIKQAIWEEFDRFSENLDSQEGFHFDEVGEMSLKDEGLCKDAFKGDFDVDLFIHDILENNIDFREKIENYVESL